MKEKRDFREETALNAAEEALLNKIAGKFGVSKSAYLFTSRWRSGYTTKQIARYRDY